MSTKLGNRFLLLLTQKEQREGRRIRNKEIAQAVRVTEHTVARWMKNDVNKIDVPVLEAFCRYFNCDVGDLLHGTGLTQGGFMSLPPKHHSCISPISHLVLLFKRRGALDKG